MAENKQYITQPHENGCVMISEDVLATIAQHALTEIEGYAGLSNNSSAEVMDLTKKNGILVTITEENKLLIECNLLVAYGASVMNVAKSVQRAICKAIESRTGIQVEAVNVNVCGIIRK